MSAEIYGCGPSCEHEHNSINGPTGCCPKGHGPYLYFCVDCHEAWRAANPERVAAIGDVAIEGGAA